MHPGRIWFTFTITWQLYQAFDTIRTRTRESQGIILVLVLGCFIASSFFQSGTRLTCPFNIFFLLVSYTHIFIFIYSYTSYFYVSSTSTNTFNHSYMDITIIYSVHHLLFQAHKAYFLILIHYFPCIIKPLTWASVSVMAITLARKTHF